MSSTITKKNLIATGIYILSFLSIIIIVQICSSVVDNELILPNVGLIFKSFFKLMFEGKTYGYIGKTLYHLIVALLISGILGAILGVSSGLNKYVRMFLKPWMAIFRSIPLAGAIVLIMILAGLTKAPYVICIFMTISIVYEGFYKGIVSLDKDLMDVWKLDSKINFKVIAKIHLPLITSHASISLINALGIGIKVVIMAEYIVGSKNTLGGAIYLAANQLEYQKVYAYSIIMVILVLLLEYIPKLIIHFIRYLKINHFNKKKIVI